MRPAMRICNNNVTLAASKGLAIPVEGGMRLPNSIFIAFDI